MGKPMKQKIIFAWDDDDVHMEEGWSDFPGDPSKGDVHTKYAHAEIFATALKAAIAESKLKGRNIYDSKMLVLKIEAIIASLEDAQ